MQFSRCLRPPISKAARFEDLPLKQSVFLLDEIEQYLSVNKFVNHDKSVEYFNNSITVDGFEVKPENLVLAMYRAYFVARSNLVDEWTNYNLNSLTRLPGRTDRK